MPDLESSRASIYETFEQVYALALEVFRHAKNWSTNDNSPPIPEIQELERQQEVRKRELENSIVDALVNYMWGPSDVRRFVAILRSTANLERIAENSIQIVLAIRDNAAVASDIRSNPDLRTLWDQVEELLEDAVLIFLREQEEKIPALQRLEEQIDQTYRRLTNHTLHELEHNPSPQAIRAGFLLMNLVRRLERIADHGSNMVENYLSIVKEEA